MSSGTEAVSDSLFLSREIRDQMMEQARRELPNECCGLLAGAGNRVTEIFPAVNALASPTEYEIAPQELFELFRTMREKRLDLVAIYHSHPSGDNVPSQRDLDRAYYPQAAYVIVSPDASSPNPVRTFQISGDDWRECSVLVES